MPAARSVGETGAARIVRLDAARAEAELAALADLLADAVASGASVNFLAGFSAEDAAAFWRGQIPGLKDGSRILIAAEAEGRLVGTAVVNFAPQPNAPHRAEITKMLVHSSHRRRGLGRMLLEAAEEASRESGRTLVILDTAAGSAGEALYRRTGWIEYGVLPGHSLTTDGVPAPAVFFYKVLAP